MKSPANFADTSAHGTTTRTVLGARGLLSAVLLVMLGNGVLNPLLGVRAELEGFATPVTGLVLASYYVGFLAGASVAPRLVVLVGHIRVYAALASLASTATLVYIVTSSPVVWSGARLVTGFAMCGLYIVAESWLNDATTNRTRGRLLAAYMVILMGGMALGQMLLTLADPSGIILFILSSILVSVAVIPITLSTAPGPRLPVPTRLPIRRVWEAAPLGLIAAFGQGAGVAALLSLGAVYGARVGMSVDRIAVFMTCAIIGSVVLQGPIGMISDQVGRRRVIMAIGLLTAGSSLAMVQIEHLSWWALIISFLVGGMALPMHPLALSHINDRVPPGSAVGVSSVVSAITGVGAIIGPIIAALFMDGIGPEGLFWFIGAVYAGITGLALLRILTHEGVAAKERRAFTMVPARAGTVVLHVARRRRRSAKVLENPEQRGSHGSQQVSDEVVCEPVNPAGFVSEHPPGEKRRTDPARSRHET